MEALGLLLRLLPKLSVQIQTRACADLVRTLLIFKITSFSSRTCLNCVYLPISIASSLINAILFCFSYGF